MTTTVSQKTELRLLVAMTLSIIALAVIIIPGLTHAATYAYVNQAGEVSSVQATDPMTAIDTAPNRAVHSGVLLLSSVVNGLGVAPTISDVSVNAARNSASVSWNTDQSAQGVVYYSTSPLTIYERLHSVDVSGSKAMTDTSFRSSQSVSLSSLDANTTYFYLVYVTDQAGNVSVTVPSTFKTSN